MHHTLYAVMCMRTFRCLGDVLLSNVLPLSQFDCPGRRAGPLVEGTEQEYCQVLSQRPLCSVVLF